MRVLHILNHTFRANGNVHAAIDLACAQAAQGHQVSVACSAGGSFDDLLHEHGVEIQVIEHRRRFVTLIKALAALFRLSQATRPDVVHAHMMTSALLAWPVTRILSIPLVTTVHNAFERSAILMGLGDRVIAVSEAVRAYMAQRGIPKARLRVVLNGTVGSARLPFPAPEAEVLERPAIVSVCGLHPRKGVADLIDAFKLISEQQPDAHLYIVGEGPMRDDYEALAEQLGLTTKIHFVGWMIDPRPYLKGADIFVLASHEDPAPLVVCEAREAGCAIVATDVDGIPQLLDAGRAGILIPPKRPDAIAAAVLHLINENNAMQSYRAKSLVNIEAFSVARVARETVKIYEDCSRRQSTVRAPSNVRPTSQILS